MPRAVDPSLIGRQIPVDHSPLVRIPYSNRKPKYEIGDLAAQALVFVEDYIFPAIEELTGIDLSIFLPLFQPLDMSSPEAFLQSLAEGLIAAGTALLGPNSPLNALNLFNLVPSTLLGQIDVSHIGTIITNLITDGDFQDPTPITGWIHSLTGGFGGSGSRTVTADGTNKELLGNLIPVSKDQIVPVTGKAKWTGLVGSGAPVALGVTGYLNGTATTQAVLASHNTTPATTDWLDLTGQYVVPANVDAIRTRLIVGPTATAGDVSFSKVGATKIGPMLQRLMAGTNPGELLPDDITHLFTGITSNAVALLTKVEQAAHDALLDVLGGDLTQIDDRLQSFLDSLSPLNGSNINHGTILDDFVPGVGTIHDSIVTAVGNLDGTGFDIAKVLEVLTGQTHSVVDAGAGISSMFARLSNLESRVSALPVVGGGTGAGTADGGAVGVYDLDNFERTSSSGLGSLWLQTYSPNTIGTWSTANGHDAEWASSLPGGTGEFLCIRNNPAILRSQTDYQRVTSELSSKGTRYYDLLFNTYNYTGHDDIWLRVSDATTSLANITGIRMRHGADGSLSIVRFVNGAPTSLDSRGPGFVPAPGPGANLVGEAGVLADGALRTFRARVGASIRLAVTEIGTASGVGAANRRWGHGGRVEGHLLPLPGQERPGGLHFWSGADQTL